MMVMVGVLGGGGDGEQGGVLVSGGPGDGE